MARRQIKENLVEPDPKKDPLTAVYPADIFDDLVEWVWQTDDRHHFVYSSERVSTLLGYSVSEVLNRRFLFFLDRERSDALPGFRGSLLQIMKSEEPFKKWVCWARHQEGRAVCLELSGHPLRDEHDRIIGFRGLARDITLEKLAWDSMHRHQLLLEQEVENQLRELEGARRRAEEANQAKNEFLRHISHELRTPLHAIHGFAQLMQMDPKHPLGAEQAERVEHILESSQILTHMINQILDLTGKSEQSENPQSEPVHLIPLIQESVAALEDWLESKDIQVHTPTATRSIYPILGRPDLVRSVLRAVLDNAVKFSPAGGRITLELDSGRNDAGLLLRIRDEGRGIDSGKREKIFEGFQKMGADNKEACAAGLGVDLALCRKWMGAMGGKIWLEQPTEQKSDQGASFALWFQKADRRAWEGNASNRFSPMPGKLPGGNYSGGLS